MNHRAKKSIWKCLGTTVEQQNSFLLAAAKKCYVVCNGALLPFRDKCWDLLANELGETISRHWCYVTFSSNRRGLLDTLSGCTLPDVDELSNTNSSLVIDVFSIILQCFF